MELLSILEIDYKELRTKAILALENPDIQFSVMIELIVIAMKK